MKKWILWASTLIILLLMGIGSWFYFKIQEKNKLLEYVPNDVDVLIYFNFKKLFLEGVDTKDTGRFGLIKRQIENTPYLPKLDELKNAGIDPFGDAVFFYRNHRPYLGFLLKDVEDFEELLLKKYKFAYRFQEDSEFWKVYRSLDNKINFLWSKEVVFIRYMEDAKQEFDFKLLKPEYSFYNSDQFKFSENVNSPIWFYSKINPFRDNVPLKGTIRFKKGLEIEACGLKDSLSVSMEYPELKSNYEAIFLSDSFHSKINTFIEAVFTQNSLNDTKADPIFLKKHSSKNLLLYDGHQDQSSQIEKYEYDDNFNKVLVTETIHREVHGFAFLKSDTTGQIAINTNYNFKDSGLLNAFGKHTTHYISFDNNFISNIYAAKMPFKLFLIGKHEEGGNYYRLKIEFFNTTPSTP